MRIKQLFTILIITILLFYCNNENSKDTPSSLELISIDSLFIKQTKLTENQIKTIKECLKVIKNRSYVEEKKRFEMEGELIKSIKKIEKFGTDATFSIPVMVYLFARDDHASDLTRKVILQMGRKAIPYLKDSLEINSYLIIIKVKALLYELDSKKGDKYLKELIECCFSVNKRERLYSLNSLAKISGIDKKLIKLCIDKLNDTEQEIVLTATNILLKYGTEVKAILEKSLNKATPIQVARIIRILWTQSNDEERADLEQVLRKTMEVSNEKETRILTKIMYEANISEIPEEKKNLIQILRSKNFIHSDWQIFLKSRRNNLTLVSLMGNEDFYVRLHALLILAHRGEHLESFNIILKKGLESSNKKVVNATLNVVNIIIFSYIPNQVAIGNNINHDIMTKRNLEKLYESLIYPLANLLGREESIAAKSGLLLKVWGDRSVIILKKISRSSKDKIQSLRANGLLLYFKSVKDKKQHLKIVHDALKDSNPKIREIATDMLIMSIVPPEQNIPAIIDALALERRNSIRAVASLYFADKTAIPYLQEAIHNRNPRIAVKAMGILARNSRNAAKYVPILAQAFERGDIEVKKDAVKALEDLKEEAVTAAHSIIPGLGSNDIDLSWRCKSALKYMGKGVTDSLIKYGITSSNKKTALISHSLLVRFNVNRDNNLEPLIDALNTQFRQIALRELIELKELAISTKEKLIKIFRTQKREDKNITLYAIFQIAPNKKETLNLLIKSLDDNNCRIRETACHCLGVLGPKAATSIAKLERLAKNDKYRSVRVLAKEALRRIKEY